MSLVSARNLLAPFRGVNLISILVITLLFVFFRLSSGSVRLVTGPENQRVRTGQGGSEHRSLPAVPALGSRREDSAAAAGQQSESPRTAPNALAAPTKKSGNVLDELIGGRRESASPAKEEGPNKLDDIEKSLGLK